MALNSSPSLLAPAPHSPRPAPDTQVNLDYDVAIAGGGIVGLTLACALQGSGLRVALVEANPLETNPRAAGLTQRRAYALTLLTERIFSGLGLWQTILPKIATFSQIRLADEYSPAVVTLQPKDLGLGSAELGYVGEHGVLLQTLQERLANADYLTWYCPATLTHADYESDRVTLTLSHRGETQQVTAQVLIAADGARSPIRQQAGIGTHGWQYWQSCITAVIQPEKSHGNIAREHFWTSGPFATLPLPHNRCQIVLTAPHAEAAVLIQVDETAFLAELERRYGGQLGRLQLVGDRVLFPVRLMQSDRYALPRLALIGDAAHCCHPVGGQGLNLGIRDAAALADILKAAHQRGEDIGNLRVLRRYERWRKLENLTILGFTDLLDRCFSTRWLPLVTARRLGLRLMQVTRPLKFLSLRLMTGLGGRHPQLAKRQP